MRTKNYSLRMLLGLFVAVISAAVAAHGEMKQGNAVVKTITGSATYLDELGFSHPLTVGTVLKAGHTIKTGVDSSVDLFLDQNGPNVGLDANSTLRLEKLAYEETSLGTKIDTLLDLKSGQMAGQVKKLIAASRYEVKMPKGVAKVRGTTFYINAHDGDVHVTEGTVKVDLTLTTINGTFTRTGIVVTAGQSLFIPPISDTGQSEQDFLNSLVAVSTPPNVQFNHLDKYVRTGDGAVAESFTGQKQNNKIQINKPPTSLVVSP